MKKLPIALLLLALLLLPYGSMAGMPLQDPKPALTVMMSGVIVNETEKTIEVKSGRDGSTIIFNLEAIPYIVDCVSGQPLSIKDRKSDAVIVYHSPVMTRSMPPQSNPVLIICDMPQDYIPPRYSPVESIERINDTVKVTVGEGSLIVTITKDTPISPYLTRNIVSIDDIDEGTELLLWCPFIAMSYPGQATAQKVVILGKLDESQGRVPSDSGDKDEASLNPASVETSESEILVYLDGKKLVFDVPPCIINNRVLVPLRAIFEEMGAEIDYDPDARKVTAVKGDTEVILSIGNPLPTINGIPVPLDQPGIIENGRTLAPLRFVAEAFGGKVEWDGETRTASITM